MKDLITDHAYDHDHRCTKIVDGQMCAKGRDEHARDASARPDRTLSRSTTEWTVLEGLRQHQYDYRDKGSHPADPGWHKCSCGWEGYWCDFHPHVAERIAAAVQSPCRIVNDWCRTHQRRVTAECNDPHEAPKGQADD